MICPEKIFVSLRKLRDISNFLGMSGKNILVTCHPPPPPSRQQFWGEILIFSSLPVRANYTVPPNKIRPIRPCILV